MKRLNGWDAFFLYSETPNMHQHTLKIAVVDTTDFAEAATFDVFVRTFKHRLPQMQALRYQLVNIPLHLHRPMWRERVELDLDYHLRKVRVAAPGGRRELDEAIGEIASTPLDRNHPLWELHFAEGLAGNRVAVISKIHHALADGVASANLVAKALEWPGPPTGDGDERADPTPSTAELLRAAGVDHLGQLRRLPRAMRETLGGVVRVGRRARERGRHPDLADYSSAPPTFINHRLSPRRRFATATLSLAEFKQTSKHLGITINDLVLATAAGGLRTLLQRYDGTADQPIVATVPASTDLSPDRVSGNELSMMTVSLPVHVPDPLERVRLTTVATGVAKEDHELLGRRTISTWIEYSPATAVIAAFRWMSRRETKARGPNLSISNVPGPRQRGTISGAVVSEIYSVGPLVVGAGINITVWSYVDQLNISVLSDDVTLPDPHEATDAMIAGFAEIRQSAGLSAELAEVSTAMPQAGKSA